MKGCERWKVRERMNPSWMAKREREKKKEEEGEEVISRVFSVSQHVRSCNAHSMTLTEIERERKKKKAQSYRHR